MPGKLIIDDGHDIYTSAAEGMRAVRAKLPRDIAPEEAPWRGGPIADDCEDFEPLLSWRTIVFWCAAAVAFVWAPLLVLAWWQS